jgi:hypothetical protein
VFSTDMPSSSSSPSAPVLQMPLTRRIVLTLSLVLFTISQG